MLNDSECIQSDLQVQDRAVCPAYESNSCLTKTRSALLRQGELRRFTSDLVMLIESDLDQHHFHLPRSKWLCHWGAALKICCATWEKQFYVL